MQNGGKVERRVLVEVIHLSAIETRQQVIGSMTANGFAFGLDESFKNGSAFLFLMGGDREGHDHPGAR